MTAVYLLIYVPILLFVVAFLYETFLSFRRIGNKKRGRGLYVESTWEVTHTLLVFGVVMMLMLYTKYIDMIGELILVPTLLAMLALAVRATCYILIFYVFANRRTLWLDWLFALSHIVAALLLVWVVIQFTMFVVLNQPLANVQFVQPFLIGLGVVVAVTIVPIILLYKARD